MDRKLLKTQAKEVLKKHYVKLLGFTFITVVLGLTFIGFGAQTSADTYTTSYYLSIFGLSFNVSPSGSMAILVAILTITSLVFGIAVSPVLNYGLQNAYKYASTDSLEGYDLFCGFRKNYKNIVIVNLLKGIFIALWTLVFIIPGIIKIYQWRYTNQILEEHPDWDYKQVLDASENMTHGHKMDLFVLDLSFIGWYLLFSVLDMLTIGLASFLLNPYVYQTDAEAYHWIKSLQEPEVIDVEVVEEPEIIE